MKRLILTFHVAGRLGNEYRRSNGWVAFFRRIVAVSWWLPRLGLELRKVGAAGRMPARPTNRNRRRSSPAPLVLHVGTHKTGTTSIQAVLAAQRAELRERGVYYPDPRPSFGGTRRAHFRLAHAMTGTEPREVEEAFRFVDHVEADVRSGETIVLSAEPIYRHVFGRRGFNGWRPKADEYWTARRGYLEELASVLSPFKVRVLIFLRRQDDFAESLYHERVVKGGFAESFETFLQLFERQFDYSAQVELLRNVFGTVEVQTYRGGGHDVIPQFFESIGLGAVSTPKRWERRSANPRLTLWLDERDPIERARQREFLQSPEAAALFAGEARSGFWRDTIQRDEFLSRFGGPYGPAFFEPPAASVPGLAQLDTEDRARVDAAYKEWRSGAG